MVKEGRRGFYVGLREQFQSFEMPRFQVFNSKGEAASWLCNPDGTLIAPIDKKEVPNLKKEKEAYYESQREAARQQRAAEQAEAAAAAKAGMAMRGLPQMPV
jgi:hypothetical protein